MQLAVTPSCFPCDQLLQDLLPFFPFCHGLHPELEAKSLSPFNCYSVYFYLSNQKRN